MRVLIAAVASLAVLGVLWAVVMKGMSEPGGTDGTVPLVVFVAASNQPVFEAVRRDYEAAHGVTLQVQFGASQTLLAGIEVSKTGDLYLPADDSYLAIAREKKLAGETFPLATMRAVVAVAKGNPKKIAKWDDLLRADVRLAQASPDAAAVGKLTRAALTKSGLWDVLAKHTTVYTTNVAEAANNVKVGGVDVAIIYDAMLHDYPTLEAVRMSELNDVVAHVAVATLTTSRQPERAAKFARYLSSPDGGLKRYREFGFDTAGAKVER